jgi:hypothetical protein
MNRMITRTVFTALLLGCGGPQNPRTENLTAAQHEAEAQREEQSAQEHQERYDPSATTTRPSSGSVDVERVVNPTSGELDRAEAHRTHAQAHRERAAELRTFEARECRGLSDSERAACPLLLDLERVDDVERGVRLVFAPGTDLAPIESEIRCHLAFAAAQGREGIDQCALYVHGASARAENGSMLLTTTEPDRVAELRQRARLQAPR